MTHLSLFSGIGGIDLAAEWAGFESVGFVERDEFCQKVLAKNFPGVPIFNDVTTFDGMAMHRANIWSVDWDKIESMALSKKYDNAPARYAELLSIGEVAKEYGVTRQAMHTILKRRGVNFLPNLRFGRENHFYRGGSMAKDVAQNKLEEAVNRGEVVRPDVCSVCGVTPPKFKDGRSPIQAHHDDYDKPLDVQWVCQKCHHQIHKQRYLTGIQEVPNLEAPTRLDLVSAGFP